MALQFQDLLHPSSDRPHRTTHHADLPVSSVWSDGYEASSLPGPVHVGQALVQLKARRGLTDGTPAGESGLASALETLHIRRASRLSVGAPDDAFERQADQMADRVVGSPELAPARNLEPLLSLSSSSVQRSGEGGGAPGGLEARLGATSGGGEPLPAQTRAYMEPRFGADFGQVKVHTGGEAIQLSQDLGARAFTHGTNIYFGDGQFDPGSREGNHLIAHELTHVVQQGGASQVQRKPDTGVKPGGMPGVNRGSVIWRALSQVRDLDGQWRGLDEQTAPDRALPIARELTALLKQMAADLASSRTESQLAPAVAEEAEAWAARIPALEAAAQTKAAEEARSRTAAEAAAKDESRKASEAQEKQREQEARQKAEKAEAQPTTAPRQSAGDSSASSAASATEGPRGGAVGCLPALRSLGRSRLNSVVSALASLDEQYGRVDVAAAPDKALPMAQRIVALLRECGAGLKESPQWQGLVAPVEAEQQSWEARLPQLEAAAAVKAEADARAKAQAEAAAQEAARQAAAAQARQNEEAARARAEEAARHKVESVPTAAEQRAVARPDSGAPDASAAVPNPGIGCLGSLSGVRRALRSAALPQLDSLNGQWLRTHAEAQPREALVLAREIVSHLKILEGELRAHPSFVNLAGAVEAETRGWEARIPALEAAVQQKAEEEARRKAEEEARRQAAAKAQEAAAAKAAAEAASQSRGGQEPVRSGGSDSSVSSAGEAGSGADTGSGTVSEGRSSRSRV